VVSKLRKWLNYAAARLRARRDAQKRLSAAPPRRVLVVCYGNIYRSPFVAGWLRKNAGTVLEIRSAGFHQREGRASETGFIAIAREFGIDLTEHRSRLIRSEDVLWADLVLIMDGHNYRLMHHHYPQALAKTLWLGAVTAATPVLIEDPYRGSPERQREVANQLDAACSALLQRFTSKAADA
jgi:protein-tyrosine phosphatase